MAHILICEDMDAMRRMLTHVLSEEGHTVTESSTGEIAYDADAIAKFDLMITDINMPWVDGIEAIRLAKKIKPDLKIIAMSGGGNVSTVDYLPACLMLGASEILHKPFEPEEMLALVRTGLAAGSIAA